MEDKVKSTERYSKERNAWLYSGFDLAIQAMIEFKGDRNVLVAIGNFIKEEDLDLPRFFNYAAPKLIQFHLGKNPDDEDEESAKRVLYVFRKKLSVFEPRIESAVRDKNNDELNEIFSEMIDVSVPAVIAAKGEKLVVTRSADVIEDALYRKVDIISNNDMCDLMNDFKRSVFERLLSVLFHRGMDDIDLSEYENLPPIPKKTLAQQVTEKKEYREEIRRIFRRVGLDFDAMAEQDATYRPKNGGNSGRPN